MRPMFGLRWLLATALLVFLVLPAPNLAAQGSEGARITGVVTDENGAPMAGVQIVIVNQQTGFQSGSLSQANGRYLVVGLRAGGPYRIEARMIGYGLEAVDDVVLKAGETFQASFSLGTEAIAMDALEIFATRAIERQTPVAYTDVPKVQIQNMLGSRDLPMVLNVTPSVYATQGGGGAGDARINVRGFSQRNTAVMINGVPVNDMENGWVYWSNWDGVGDAATSIQLQRGLSAVNLANPLHRWDHKHHHRSHGEGPGLQLQAGVRSRRGEQLRGLVHVQRGWEADPKPPQGDLRVLHRGVGQ